MNKKILLQDLSDRMSQRRGIPKKDADLFVRSIFEIIGEYLQADKIVKIKGLGTFKLVTVESRASVDVNTGERIVIKGYAKVSFTPDAALRDEINKPFAQFETVILNEGTDVAEMERMDVPDFPDLPETESVEEHPDVQVKTESVPETIVPSEEPSPREVDAHENEAPEEDLLETAAVPSQETEVHVENQQVKIQKVEHQTVENQHIVQVAPEQKECRCTLPVWRRICICMAVLLSICGSYYAGHKHLLCPGDCGGIADVAVNDVKKGETTSGNKVNSTAKKEPRQQPESTGKVSPGKTAVEQAEIQKAEYPQIEGGDYEIVGTKDVHRLKSGETLRGLALKYYGSKDYVDYIIIYNDIKNPDIVPVNMELKLPELKLKRR